MFGMMKKVLDNKYLFALVVALIFLNFLAWKYKGVQRNFVNCKSLNELLEEENIHHRITFDEIVSLKELELKVSNFEFPNLKIQNVEGDKFVLKEMVEDYVWVFRFHESSCNPCIIDNLNLISSANPENFIILASFTSFASFRAFAQNYDIENFYFIDTDFNLPLIPSDRHFLPIYFGLSDALQINYPTIPPRGSLKISKQFLNFVGQ